MQVCKSIFRARICCAALGLVLALSGSAAAAERTYEEDGFVLVQDAAPEAPLPTTGPRPNAPRSNQAKPRTTPNTNPNATPGPATPSPRSTTSNNNFALSGATRSLGGAGSQQSVATYMVGDFFSSSGQIFFSVSNPNAGGLEPRPLAEIPAAGGSRRVKISENNSPIPRDRIFYSYNGFDNAIPDFIGNTLIDVQRHTPGFEKTFLDGMGSIELRTPVAYTQNSNVFLNGGGPLKATEFGNISLALKMLLWTQDDLYVAGGLGLNLPTADDTNVFNFGDRLLTIKTQSVHVLPYVGALWLPSERFYVQGFLQLDVDTNGNPINSNFGQQGAVLNDQTLLYADVSMGYWLMRDDEARVLTGIIPLLEFHYTTTLQNADIVTVPTTQGSYSIGNLYNRFDVPNITVGTHFRIGPKSLFTVAGCLPLNARDDQRQFDSEIIAQFNRFF